MEEHHDQWSVADGVKNKMPACVPSPVFWRAELPERELFNHLHLSAVQPCVYSLCRESTTVWAVTWHQPLLDAVSALESNQTGNFSIHTSSTASAGCFHHSECFSKRKQRPADQTLWTKTILHLSVWCEFVSPKTYSVLKKVSDFLKAFCQNNIFLELRWTSHKQSEPSSWLCVWTRASLNRHQIQGFH